jgi:flagellar protein FliS
MLYDGAIRFLERALTGFAMDDPAEANSMISNNILRAQDIVYELNASLNVELGGELASTLRALYHFMDRQLTQSNLRKERQGIDDSINRLTILRQAWASMLNGEIPGEMETWPARAAA